MSDTQQLKKPSFIMLLILGSLFLLTSSVTTTSLAVVPSLQGGPNQGGNPNPGQPVDIPGNGSGVRLQAGNMWQVRTQSGFQVNLTVAEDVELSLNETETNPAGTLAQNQHGLGKYYQLELNNSNAQMNATLAMEYDPENLPENVTPQKLSFAFWNGTRNQWQKVVSWAHQNMVYGNTTHFSTWTVLGDAQQGSGPQVPNVPFEVPGNGTPIQIKNGSNWMVQTQSGFQLQLTVNKAVELTINQTSTNPGAAPPKNGTDMGKYLQIEMNDSSAEIQAQFKMEFSNAEVGDKDPTKLQFAYMDGNTWRFVNSSSEVASGKVYVVANTTHFSTWAVFYVEEEGSSTPGFEAFALLGLAVVVVPVLRKRH